MWSFSPLREMSVSRKRGRITFIIPHIIIIIVFNINVDDNWCLLSENPDSAEAVAGMGKSASVYIY